MDNDSELSLVEQVQQAIADKQPLNIIGGDSKSFYGRTPQGKPLSNADHAGVINYEPSELVITARAGTKISQIYALLAKNNQMLGFEPPFCNADSTLGGLVAAGLSGPRRPYAGAVREFVLGVKIINGKGEVLKFGGQVMKNVAGFDHSRLMAGSLGTLGVLLEISLRVMPVAEIEQTITLEQDNPDTAIEFFNRLAAKPYPITATCWRQGQSQIRLSGTENGVAAAIADIGGDSTAVDDSFWSELKNHKLSEFKDAAVVQRVGLPSAAGSFGRGSEQIIEWNGAQRWLFNQITPELKHQISDKKGQITHFRGGDRNTEIFSALDPVSMRLHQNIKNAFDPHGIFNPGRMYQDF